MLSRPALVLFAFVTLACGGVAPLPPLPVPIAPPSPAVQADDSQVELVQAIYRGYVAGRPPDMDELPWTRELRTAFAAMQARDEMGLGFDPLIGGQDFEITDVQINMAPDGWIEARFKNFGTPMVVRWSLVEEDGGLRIAEVDTPDGSLSTLLRP